MRGAREQLLQLPPRPAARRRRRRRVGPAAGGARARVARRQARARRRLQLGGSHHRRREDVRAGVPSWRGRGPAARGAGESQPQGDHAAAAGRGRVPRDRERRQGRGGRRRQRSRRRQRERVRPGHAAVVSALEAAGAEHRQDPQGARQGGVVADVPVQRRVQARRHRPGQPRGQGLRLYHLLQRDQVDPLVPRRRRHQASVPALLRLARSGWSASAGAAAVEVVPQAQVHVGRDDRQLRQDRVATERLSCVPDGECRVQVVYVSSGLPDFVERIQTANVRRREVSSLHPPRTKYK